MAVGGGSSSIGSVGGPSVLYGGGTPASETDGETFDGEADFDDYDEWDYAEILSNLSKNMKTYVLQPLVVGASAAFGMSIGYAMFDATASLFTRRPASSTRSR